MIYIILPILVGILIAVEIITGGFYYSNYELKAERKKQLVAGLDADGLPLKYEPHYTRSIEIEQGLQGRLTQCDNTDCQTCYWKAGKKQRAEMLPGQYLRDQFYEWNDELPDGLSDELYESMYEDWLKSPSVVNFINIYNNNLERRKKSDEYFGRKKEPLGTSSKNYKTRDNFEKVRIDDLIGINDKRQAKNLVPVEVVSYDYDHKTGRYIKKVTKGSSSGTMTARVFDISFEEYRQGKIQTTSMSDHDRHVITDGWGKAIQVWDND